MDESLPHYEIDNVMYIMNENEQALLGFKAIWNKEYIADIFNIRSHVIYINMKYLKIRKSNLIHWLDPSTMFKYLGYLWKKLPPSITTVKTDQTSLLSFVTTSSNFLSTFCS